MITSALQAVSVVRGPANSRCSVCAEWKSGDRLDLRMDGWIDGWMHLKVLHPSGPQTQVSVPALAFQVW